MGRDGRSIRRARSGGARGARPAASRIRRPARPPRPDADVAWTPGRDRPPVRISVDGLVHRYPGGVEARPRRVAGDRARGGGGRSSARTGRARPRWSSTSTASSDRLRGGCCSTAPRPTIGPWPSSPGRSASSSRTPTTSSSSARSSARSRSARATWASRPATSRRSSTRSLAAVGLAERAHDQPIRPRPVAAQARRAGRDPRHGSGRPRARRADDRPGCRRRRADRRDHRGLPAAPAARSWRSPTTWSSPPGISPGSSSCATGEVVADGAPAEVFVPANGALLASTGLTLPPAARIAARLGLDVAVLDAPGLLAALRR